MILKLYEFAVFKHVSGREQQVGEPIAHHLDLSQAEVAQARLLHLLADAARRDGARARDVWQYSLQVRDLGERRPLFTYVVTPVQVEGLPW